MKLFLKILRKIAVVLGYLLSVILVTLVCAMLFSRKDYGNPETPIGEQMSKMAFSNVNLISMEEGQEEVARHVSVLIDNGTISQIIPDSITIPSAYNTIDAEGKYLMPGLIDMHTHIFDRSDLAIYLAHGVTTVRNMMGLPMHLRWRQQLAANEYPGARLITASPTINSGGNGGPFHKNVANATEAIAAVKAYAEKGYDLIKIYDGLNEEQFLAIMEEAKRNNVYVAGHPPHQIDLDVLLQSDIRSFEHVEEIVQGMMAYKLDTVLGRSIAKKLKSHDSRVTITLAPFHNIYKATTEGEAFLENIPKENINPFIRFIGEKQMAEWVDSNAGTFKWHVEKYQCMLDLLRILQEEQVALLLGTDTGPSLTIPGLSLHKEIELLYKNGIPAYDILKSGTVNAAKALGKEKEFGTLAIGKKAELVLVSQNPLTNLASLKNPVGVMSNGLWYDQARIEELRTLGKDKSNIFLTVGRFLNHMVSK
ncbi:MAG: hypothetical protein COA50_03810 [Flavobacteriaceae bacterium]|nr:MAG: hypothetical protein COA50_03810 [Flavobacteriaceae bacterium]